MVPVLGPMLLHFTLFAGLNYLRGQGTAITDNQYQVVVGVWKVVGTGFWILFGLAIFAFAGNGFYEFFSGI